MLKIWMLALSIFAVLEDLQLTLQKQFFREELPLIGKLPREKSASPKYNLFLSIVLTEFFCIWFGDEAINNIPVDLVQ